MPAEQTDRGHNDKEAAMRAGLAKSMRARRGVEHGFTLVELLVVIVILGILAAIVVFAVTGIGDKGQSAACGEDRRSLETAEEHYYVDHSAYTAEAALVPAYIHEASDLHDVTVAGTTYSISNTGAC